MKFKNVFFLVLLSCSLLLQAQNYKLSVSQSVFNDIVEAYGSNKKPPILEIKPKSSKGESQILTYFPGFVSKIVMDEEVYDLCASLGKDSLNALAALLGHEIAHHYEKHDWCSSFAFSMHDQNELKQKLSKITKEEKLRLEAEADYFGGFYGYVAGYATYDISENLLDLIYKHYKLPDNLKGYPSKVERKQIAQKALKDIEQYAVMFEVASFLFCTKEYEAAFACFDHLTNKFPSREMFSNAGVLRLFMALDNANLQQLPFKLPIEIDASSRLRNALASRSNTAHDEKWQKIIETYITDAIKYFDKAISISTDYVPAYLHKASAHILLNNPEMAIGISNELLSLKKYKTDFEKSKILSVRAIAYYKTGDKSKSLIDFENALKAYNNQLTSYNLKVYKEINKDYWDGFVAYIQSFFEEENKTIKNELTINPLEEKIAMLNPRELNINLENKTTIPFSGKPIELTYSKGEGFLNISFKHTRVNRIMIAEKAYKGKTSQGLGIGANENAIIAKYGHPSYIKEEVNGKYLIYRKSRILFLLDRSGKLTKWMIYY